jgi:hypothetical protein
VPYTLEHRSASCSLHITLFDFQEEEEGVALVLLVEEEEVVVGVVIVMTPLRTPLQEVVLL